MTPHHPDSEDALETATVERFRSSVRPMLSLLKTLSVRNVNLRQTRDLLLPRLISGEVDVEKLDIEIPGNAA